MAMRRGPRELPPLSAGTTARDQQWWDSLVECNSQRVWEVARGRGLDASEPSPTAKHGSPRRGNEPPPRTSRGRGTRSAFYAPDDRYLTIARRRGRST